MLTIKLYTTDHCSLCEQALDLLLGMPEMAGFELLTVDIAADDQLMQTYGELIPVLEARGYELISPFDRASVQCWLAQLQD